MRDAAKHILGTKWAKAQSWGRALLLCAAAILVGCPAPNPQLRPTQSPEGPPACYPGAGQPVCVPTLLWPPPEAAQYPPSKQAIYATPTLWLDLGRISAQTALASNFTLGELTVHARRHGRFVSLQPYAIRRLQEVRDTVGPVRVNSSFRNPTHNHQEGGKPFSRHQYGDGFDLKPMHASLGALQRACKEAGASFTKRYRTHVHCDWRFGSSRGDNEVDVSGWVARIVRQADGALRLEWEGFDEGVPTISWRALDAEGKELARLETPDPVPEEGQETVDPAPIKDQGPTAEPLDRFTPPAGFATIVVELGGVKTLTVAAADIAYEGAKTGGNGPKKSPEKSSPAPADSETPTPPAKTPAKR